MSTPNEIVQDARFEEILQLEGLSIQDYYEPIANTQMFPDAYLYPSFFNENLVSPNRILKLFASNPQSNIRIFYVQILRLGYEIEVEGVNSRNFILNLRRIVFHPEFEILFTQDTDEKRDIYNDFQFKKLFAEFLVLLDKQQTPNVLQTLTHYPMIDTVFVHILRSLLATQNINEEFDVKIPTQVVFGELSTLLELTITSYGNCWKFEDSDMFCYEESDNELYLAYIVQNDRQEEQNQSYQQYNNSYIEPNPTYYQPPKVPVNQYPYPEMQRSMTSNKPTASMISQNYQFTDYLGTTTIQKHKVPRQQGEKEKEEGLAKNFDGFLNKLESNIKSSFAYQGNNDNTTKLSEKITKNDYQTSSYKPTDYFSTTTYEKKYDQYKPNYGTYQADYKPQQKPYKPQQKPMKPDYSSNYKPYEVPLSKSSITNNSYNYGNHDSLASNYKATQYKPVQYIPSTVYKPAEPAPKYETYKSQYTETKRYDTFDYKPSSSNTFQTTNYNTNSSYKPSYESGVGDYYNDFTSLEILSKLRATNRQNVHKIKESMKGIAKGAELPPDFDIRKSAIYNNTSSSTLPKEELFRSQSRSQFEYTETYKSLPTKPFTADLSSYTSNKPFANAYSNFAF